MVEAERSLMPFFGELTKSNFKDQESKEEIAARLTSELQRLEQRDKVVREAIILANTLNESSLSNPLVESSLHSSPSEESLLSSPSEESLLSSPSEESFN